MLNYFIKKEDIPSNDISFKKRALILAVAILITAAVYGAFLYSTKDVLVSPKPSLGISIWEKQIMFEYMAVHIGELSPEAIRTDADHFKIDSISYQDSSTAIVRYNDGETYYEAEAKFVIGPVDPETQKETIEISSFTLLRDDIQPLQ